MKEVHNENIKTLITWINQMCHNKNTFIFFHDGNQERAEKSLML